MSDSVTEYREMEIKALSLRIGQLESELLDLRESARTGKEKNHSRLRFLKSEVARAKTVLREKEE
jgi:ribosomal protein L29